MTQALYRKWRPARFDDVVGQEHITRTLRNSVAADRVGHAFLFSGPRGTGKTTSARLLAKAVNCLDPDPTQRPCDKCNICIAINEARFLDLIEIDAASNTGVDDMRSLRDKINFAPNEGRFKVYIIDEVHMLSIAAFNALLKTLEEPPPHAKFVLATTEEHKVPITIKSRCQVYNFRLLTTQEILGRLGWLAEQEDLTIEPEAMGLIARQGAGSLRDAESLLDQLVTAPGDVITLERAQKVLGTASSESIISLTQALLSGDGATGLGLIHEALAAGTDVRQFARQMVTFLRGVLLLKTAGGRLSLDLPPDEQAQMGSLAQMAEREVLVTGIKAFTLAATATSSSWQPQLPLELAFIESLPAGGAMPAFSPPPTTSPTAQPKPTPQPLVAKPTAAETTAPPTPPPSPPAAEKAEPAPKDAAPVRKIEKPVEENAGISLSQITSQWAAIMNLIGQQDRNLRSLLASAKPLGTEGNTLVIGFDFPVLREKFDKRQNGQAIVSGAISQILGTNCLVRSVESSQYKPPAPPITSDEFQTFADEIGGIVKGE